MNRLNLKPNESLFTTQKGDALILNKETSEWRELTKIEKNILVQIANLCSRHPSPQLPKNLYPPL